MGPHARAGHNQGVTPHFDLEQLAVGNNVRLKHGTVPGCSRHRYHGGARTISFGWLIPLNASTTGKRLRLSWVLGGAKAPGGWSPNGDLC